VNYLYTLPAKYPIQIKIIDVQDSSYLAGTVIMNPRSTGAVAAIGDIELVAVAPWSALIHLLGLIINVAAGKTPVKITSTGITVTGIADTCVQTLDFFRNGPGNSQKFFNVGNVDFRSGSHSMLAIHANKVITFDLDAIRNATGYKDLRFCTMVGYGGAADPTVDFSVYIDGIPLVNSTPIIRAGMSLDLPMDFDERFLTLVVTDGNKNISHDQIFFGDPMLVPKFDVLAKKDEKKSEQRNRLIAEIEKLKGKISTYPTLEAVLKGIRLDMESFEGHVNDCTVRPDGLACYVRAWSPGFDANLPPDLKLMFTEFTDPDGEAIFFNVPNPNSDIFVDDELIAK